MKIQISYDIESQDDKDRVHRVLSADDYAEALHEISSQIRVLLKYGEDAWINDSAAERFLHQIQEIIKDTSVNKYYQ